MITASALTIYAEHAKYPEPFEILGWFILAISLTFLTWSQEEFTKVLQ
ncbi:MAG: hypothetical protein ACJATN_000811 [Neolewinella sp.]|jgi:hypothetical protein